MTPYYDTHVADDYHHEEVATAARPGLAGTLVGLLALALLVVALWLFFGADDGASSVVPDRPAVTDCAVEGPGCGPS